MSSSPLLMRGMILWPCVMLVHATQLNPKEIVKGSPSISPATAEHAKEIIKGSASISPALQITAEHCLGSGYFGKVYREMHNGMPVAVKEIPLKNDPIYLKLLLGEVTVLREIAAHPEAPACLLRLQGHYWGKDESVGLVLEFIEGRDLEPPLKKWILQDENLSTPSPFSERIIAKIMHSVLHGLVFMHRHGLLHRDIKPGNIMITQAGEVKLIDFGMAKQAKSIQDGSCSPGYASPELLQNQPHGPPHDCWGLAATAFHLYTGLMPLQLIPNFSEKRDEYLKLQVMPLLMNKHVYPQLQDHLVKASPEFRGILTMTLVPDPSGRPQATKLLNYPFLRSANQATSDELKAFLTLNY